MSKPSSGFLGLCLCAALTAAGADAAGAAELRGHVVDSSTGLPLSGVGVVVRASTGQLRRGITNAAGAFKFVLPAGAYGMQAARQGFETYRSAPAVVLVGPGAAAPLQIRLRSSALTTVLLVRHADRQPNDDALTDDGVRRAQDLVQVASKAAVSAIFATEAERSRQTAQPLAAHLGLPIESYSSDAASGPDQLARRVRLGLRGATVLVVAHSNTIAPVIEHLGGDSSRCVVGVDEYDAVCVVLIPAVGKTHVLNLQYGAVSPTP